MNPTVKDFKQRFGDILAELDNNKELDFDERDKAEVLVYVKNIVDNNLEYYLEIANLLDDIEKEMGIE